MRLGAQGVVLKESSPETLLECVRKVHQGEQWLDWETMSRAFGRVMRKETAARETSRILTPRETEVAQMVAQGLRNKAIAERLSISEGTVKIHLHNIYEKVKVNGRLELVLWVQERGPRLARPRRPSLQAEPFRQRFPEYARGVPPCPP